MTFIEIHQIYIFYEFDSLWNINLYFSNSDEFWTVDHTFSGDLKNDALVCNILGFSYSIYW